MKEDFGPFFLVLSSVTNLKGLFIRVHKLFWQLLWKRLEHFFGPKRLLTTQIFEKKINNSIEKKIIWPILIILWIRTNLRDKITLVHRLFSQTLSNLLEDLLRPKRLLKTQFFEKKGKLLSEEKNLARFFSFLRTRKTSGTAFKGAQGVLTNFVQLIRSFLSNLKSR